MHPNNCSNGREEELARITEASLVPVTRTLVLSFFMDKCEEFMKFAEACD